VGKGRRGGGCGTGRGVENGIVAGCGVRGRGVHIEKKGGASGEVGS